MYSICIVAAAMFLWWCKLELQQVSNVNTARTPVRTCLESKVTCVCVLTDGNITYFHNTPVV